MKSLVSSALLVVCLHVPFALTMSVGNLPVYDLLRETGSRGPLMDEMSKRGAHEVDAWSICPPHMTEVDCFYAYLRVYARLRKAAEKSDRVSMRNIGKRSSSEQSQFDDEGMDELLGTESPSFTESVDLSGTGRRGASESGSRRGLTIRRLLELCPDDMTPAMCFEAARDVYRRVLASLNNNSRLK